MPTVTLPPIGIPPITIPWPSPRPGVGTPLPSPSVSPAPSGGSTAVPVPIAGGGNGPLEPITALFRFSLDWRFLGALLFMLLTVGITDEVWPQYVWPYVGILLLGLTLTNIEFSPRFGALFG